jgi:hypothetical protein
MKATVNRRVYRNAPQAELAMFSNNTLQRIRSNPEFGFLTDASIELETRLNNYQNALSAAQNRGLVEVSAKREAREKLVEALDAIVDLLESQHELSETRILEAGFKPNDGPVRTAEVPPVPKVVKAIPTGNRGEVKVHLNTWEGANRARLLHMCEYSDDQGQTWKYGLFNPAQRFLINGLPPLSTIQLRFRSVAPNGKASLWSEVVEAAVN